MKTLFLILALLLLPMQAHALGTLTCAAGDCSKEQSIETGAATMVNGNTIFTITGGPIIIVDLVSVCVTTNDGTNSTLQWSSTPTVGAAATFSGASATLASKAAGTTVRLNQTAITTAPDISASTGGVLAGGSALRTLVKEGTITMVIGVGSTTGTWKHILRYIPLSPNASVR